MTPRSGVLVACAALAGASVAQAQVIRLGIEGVGITYSEVDAGRRAEGAGVGGTATLRLGRFALEASGLSARLEPQGSGVAFDLRQGDVRLRYAFVPSIALEIGTGRRTVEPKFASQDVGVSRLGVRSEMELNRLSSVWARGAYLVNSRFNGGGSADLAVELGLGVGVGTANGRLRARAEFEFQRIDRKVGAVGVPVQMAVGRVGLDFGLGRR